MRGIFLALCGVVAAVGLGAATPQPKHLDTAEGKQTHSELTRPQQAVLVEARENNTEGASSALTSPCVHGEENRQSDLCAQWKAADAAQKAAKWAMLGTLVAAAGTIGLYLQISLTRKALKGTGDATDEMRRANQIQEAERRPWIDFRVVSAVISHRVLQLDQGRVREIAGQGTPAIQCRLEITNAGKSPARDIHYSTTTLKGAWGRGRDHPDLHAPGGEEFYRRVTNGDIHVAALMPGESVSLGFSLGLGDDMMSEAIGLFGVRVAPRFVVFATYKGDGIDGEAQTGKVFIFAAKPGRRIDVRGENLDGVEVDWGVVDNVRHLT